ncbi:MAG: dihydropteroate synthase [Methylobacteriaceae bacterium]|nr:dihydropteroate synthase [Methylobacteriaceae bacterium]
MSERVLFLTGRLAHGRLQRVLSALGDMPFEWKIHDIGVKVAALMTEEIIRGRLPRPVEADRIIVPGRCHADLGRLSADLGVRVERGPDEITDLPRFLGAKGRPPDLARYDIRIFAEIVDAATIGLERILSRADALKAAGADVIDLGCLPDTPFPHLEDSVRELKARGFLVSVDSADPGELEAAIEAGADHVLSLDEETLGLAAGSSCIPILVPRPHGDLDSLIRVAEAAKARDIACILDPILDPINFGFSDSIARYIALRRRLPEAEIMMGTGNLTELTEADTSGITAVLLGICAELQIRNVLTVQVSPHTRCTLEEHDAARRLMFAAREDQALPKEYGAGLLQVHDLTPFVAAPDDINAVAEQVRDKNFRIETAEDGIHVYARGFHQIKHDAFGFFPDLHVEADGAHAFYLGAELTKAEIALRLGKRYIQDEPLDFGIAAPRQRGDRLRLKQAGTTLKHQGERAAKDSVEEND